MSRALNKKKRLHQLSQIRFTLSRLATRSLLRTNTLYNYTSHERQTPPGLMKTVTIRSVSNLQTWALTMSDRKGSTRPCYRTALAALQTLAQCLSQCHQLTRLVKWSKSCAKGTFEVPQNCQHLQCRSLLSLSMKMPIELINHLQK